jgi:hypothetical protein
MNPTRRFHVFDGSGEHLGSFLTFQAAHDWAHLQARLGGVPLPLDVEDRARQVTRRVTGGDCQDFAWEAVPLGSPDPCDPPEPAASPDAYVACAPWPREPLDARLTRPPARDRP